MSIQTISGFKDQKRFNSSAWCIAEMYWYNLKSYKKSPYAKVVLILGVNRLTEKFSNVYIAYKEFDFDKYFSMSEIEKKKVLLNLMHLEMYLIFKEERLDCAILENAYNNCINRKLENKWLLKDKYFISKNRKYKGGIECLWGMSSFSASAVIFDLDNNESLREILVQTEPYLGDFIYWSKCGWRENKFYLEESKSGRYWEVIIDE